MSTKTATATLAVRNLMRRSSVYRWADSIVKRALLLCIAVTISASSASALAQSNQPRLRAGTISEPIRIDGTLSERAWTTAEAADRFAQADPSEGAQPTLRTTVRVLADAKALYIGIVCDDPEPSKIVSYSV